MRNRIISRLTEIAKEENNFTKEGWEDFTVECPHETGEKHISEVGLYLFSDDQLLVIFERIIVRQIRNSILNS
jgi:hypothetical protein